MTYHSVYTVSDEFFDIAKKYNMPLHIHAFETKLEVENCIKKKDALQLNILKNLDF